MSTLPDSIAAFSADLCSLAANTSEGINSLRRTIQCKPCIGPTVFRESFKQLFQQAGAISSEVEKLQSVTLDAVSLEEVLGNCLALYKDNQRRIVELDERLRQYGYQAEYSGPVVEDPLSHLGCQPGTADAHANVACSMDKAERSGKDRPDERYSTQSPEPLGDLTGKYALDSTSTVRQLTVTPTPSPVASSLVSAVSISPSLRELQRKYAANSGESKGVRTGSTATQRDMDEKYGTASDAPTPDAIGRKLAYLALETPGGALRGSPSRLEEIAKKVDHLALEHPRFSPTNRLAPADMHTGVLSTSLSGQSPRMASGAVGAALSKSAAKKESITARLAAGEPPWDMLSLKAAIHAALPGTGEVARMISSASFQPQAAAFTSLLHMCTKAKLWQKALEVFQAMRDYHPAVRPNTVHFSSLISACATAGRFEEAMQVFAHMKAAAKSDPSCAPNVITYSALMTAFCYGGHLDKALEVFRSMRAENVRPDHICYSTLIAGFEKVGDMEMAKRLSEEMQVDGLQPGQPTPGAFAPKSQLFIDQFGRKIKQGGSLGSPRHSGGLQLSPTRAPAPVRTPHPSVGHPIWANPFPSSPKTGGHGHMSLQTPGGLGLYDTGSLQQAGDRSGFIPASYGTMYSNLNMNARGGYGVPVEENTLELRKAVLQTRSPSTAFHYGAAQDLSCLDAQTPFLPPAAAAAPNQPTASATPHHVINPNRTPSTAELLFAAQSGNTAQLSRQLYALQQQANNQAAPQENRRGVTFAPGVGSQPAGGSPTKASEGFSLFQSSHLPSTSRAQVPAVPVASPFAQHQHQAQQQPPTSAYSSGAEAFAAAAARQPLGSFDAAPGSPLASARRGTNPHARAHSRSFDAAPGSPLAPRAPPDADPEPPQHAAWNSAAVSQLYAASTLSHQGSASLQAQLSGSFGGGSLQGQPSGGFDGAFGLPPCGLNRQASTSIQHQPSGSLSAYLGASSLHSQHSLAAGSNLSRQQSAVSVGPFSQASGDFAAAVGGGGGFGGHCASGPVAASTNLWAAAAAQQPSARAGSLPGSINSATAGNAAADAAPNSVSPEEYAGLPLRLSRQLQLGAINEGLAYITRGVQAQLARGFPLDAAGMRVEELDALGLGHAQKTALLQALLQLKRLRLIMRDSQRTYTLA